MTWVHLGVPNDLDDVGRPVSRGAMPQVRWRRTSCEQDLAAAHAMLKEQTMSIAEFARHLGISRTTFYDCSPRPAAA